VTAQAPTTQRTEADDRTLGRAGEPVRALIFSSGAFDTAIHLGVVHALLVTRAPPPDVVLGISAGAVNAVALAEILQAGTEQCEGDDEKALALRVARFREIFEAYQNCPADVIDAMLPDTYEIDTHRPLRPMHLPVHEAREREYRRGAQASRSGFITLYNQLMRLPLSIGTLTRLLRRVLGLSAALDQPKWRRLVAGLVEGFRLWMLLGEHLHEFAALLPPVIAAVALPRPSAAVRQDEPGVNAATLIFRSRFWETGRGQLERAGGILLLSSFWLFLSLLIFGLIGLVGVLASGLLLAITGNTATALELLARAREAPGIAAAIMAGSVLVGAVVIALILGARGDLKRSTTLRVLVNFALLVMGWAALFSAAVVGLSVVLRALVQPAVRALGWAPVVMVSPAFVGAVVMVLAVALLVSAIAVRGRLSTSLLAIFNLADSLLDPHPLRQFFVRVFDPGYYGQIDMDAVVDRAIKRDEAAAEQPGGNKTVAGYAKPGPRAVHVALAVADLTSGELQVLDSNVLVVDALLAATAVTPLFPPVLIGGRLRIDAANVATQATVALLDFLRPRIRRDATAVHVYTVSPLPLSAKELGPDPARATDDGDYTDLVQVAARALQLQRFRDAHLDRKLTHVFSKALPPTGKAICEVDRPDGTGTETFLRTWMYPVEPEQPLDLTQRIAAATTTAERRRLVAEAVAGGCRAALQNFIGVHAASTSGNGSRVVPCLKAVTSYRQRHGQALDFPGSAKPGWAPSETGPGLSEVCEHCMLQRGSDPPLPRHFPLPVATGPAVDWGFERDLPVVPAPPSDTATEETRSWAAAWEKTRWPRPRGEGDPKSRPTISLLFSGGVFRGVYQMGVLNALEVARVRPDVVAGASIGSITAAMVARVFREEHEHERRARIARLAATYLTLDRLVLTDRFADFIRVLTIRAANSRFSLREADRVFRIFDEAWPLAYERELRSVTAGLERLFYVSPFELLALVEAFRAQDLGKVNLLLRGALREFLSRMGVGNQILGAEPLALLIAEHVLSGLPQYTPDRPGTVPFQAFLDDGIHFLATSTNLTRGRLEILGGDDPPPSLDREATLLDGLLASSAFPAVFRPRWSWEIMPRARDHDQYIDGGVTDNLPLDAVAQFLHHASEVGRLDPRPRQGTVPHLLICGSLEPRYRPLSTARQAELQFNWPALWTHARELSYNSKLDNYAVFQRNLRAVVQAEKAGGQLGLLDLELIAVKPEWLCSTFAFHPMMGFRRRRQAASIAHGCASTLLELGARCTTEQGSAWFDAWGIDRTHLPDAEASLREDPYQPRRQVAEHECWFVPGLRCPFSAGALSELGLPEATARELVTIYHACGKRETHRPDEPKEARDVDLA
jgi:predicted acylesterase/phospholipase RssA